MYCTSTLTIAGSQFIKYIPDYIESPIQSFTSGLEKWSGNIGSGQRVYVDPAGVSFTGSLSKMFLGDNVGSLTRRETELAIEFLSDTLHTDFRQAQVRRIDVAANVLVAFDPSTYYSVLGQCGRYTRSRFKNSLYYDTSTKQLIFYDKSKDAKAKSMVVPQWLRDKHILRYELRLKKGILKQLNRSSFTGQDLYDEGCYMNLLDRWLGEYNKIKKMKGMQMDLSGIEKPTDLSDQILACLVMHRNDDPQGAIDALFEQAKGAGVFKDPKAYTRAKRHIEKILQSASDSELIAELDQKVSNAVAFYR